MDKNQHNIQDELVFKTSNFSLATTLSLFEPLDNITWKDKDTAEFVFIKTPNLDLCVERYFNHDLLVDPQNFYYQLKQLKSRLYERI